MGVYVLYHASCIDGTGSRYAAWKRFGDQVRYIAVQYGSEFPNIPLNAETELYILDFSYSRKILEGIQPQVGKLVVLDHHKTAEEDLKGLPYATFDMAKSGAVLSWEYFNPGVKVPQLLRIVEDADLWAYKYPETRAMKEYLDTTGLLSDMAYWDRLANDQVSFDKALEAGQVLFSAKIKRIKKFVRSKQPKYFIRTIQGRRVAIYNTTVDISDIAEALYNDKNLQLDFTLSYFFTAKLDLVMSFRSNRMTDTDVSTIARLYGGGGHRNAAGASVPYPRSLEVLKSLAEIG